MPDDPTPPRRSRTRTATATVSESVTTTTPLTDVVSLSRELGRVEARVGGHDVTIRDMTARLDNVDGHLRSQDIVLGTLGDRMATKDDIAPLLRFRDDYERGHLQLMTVISSIADRGAAALSSLFVSLVVAALTLSNHGLSATVQASFIIAAFVGTLFLALSVTAALSHRRRP